MKTEPNTSAEQRARDILERMDIEGAQSFTGGDVVEIANLIAGRNADACDAARYRQIRNGGELSESVLAALDLGNGILLDEAIDAEIKRPTP